MRIPNYIDVDDIDDGIDYEVEKLATTGRKSSDVKQESQEQKEIYEEMKNNALNAAQLIEMIKYSGEGECDEQISHYSMKSIGSCTDKAFLLLLLKNFTRGPRQGVIENIVEKINDNLE